MYGPQQFHRRRRRIYKAPTILHESDVNEKSRTPSVAKDCQKLSVHNINTIAGHARVHCGDNYNIHPLSKSEFESILKEVKKMFRGQHVFGSFPSAESVDSLPPEKRAQYIAFGKRLEEYGVAIEQVLSMSNQESSMLARAVSQAASARSEYHCGANASSYPLQGSTQPVLTMVGRPRASDTLNNEGIDGDSGVASMQGKTVSFVDPSLLDLQSTDVRLTQQPLHKRYPSPHASDVYDSFAGETRQSLQILPELLLQEGQSATPSGRNSRVEKDKDSIDQEDAIPFLDPAPSDDSPADDIPADDYPTELFCTEMPSLFRHRQLGIQLRKGRSRDHDKDFPETASFDHEELCTYREGFWNFCCDHWGQRLLQNPALSNLVEYSIPWHESYRQGFQAKWKGEALIRASGKISSLAGGRG